MKINVDDFIGQTYNHLTIVKNLGIQENGWSYVECTCDCGNSKVLRFSDVKIGRIKTCGCSRHWSDKSLRVHNTQERLYNVWHGMKTRCYNSNYPEYEQYGGRGIEVCDEWKHSYAIFKKWAITNGYNFEAKRGECTLDRINPNGNYEPDNCRWVSMKTQSNNTRRNHLVEYKGITHTLKEWSEIYNIDYHTLSSRVHKGWSDERLFQPVNKKGGYNGILL